MSKQSKKSYLGLVGKKCGMTRIFTEDGVSLPVTVIEATPNRVCQLKTVETDGYNAVQITYGSVKPSRVNKPKAGLFAKAGVESGVKLREFRTFEENHDLKKGDNLTVDLFKAGQKVDVTGVSKGKGFQGTVKRWNFRTQDATHGNSLSHRAPGSTGMCQTPGRVFKGKKMAGQMGNARTTVQSIEVVSVDLEKSLIFVKGAIPGPTGSAVIVEPGIKKSASTA